MSHEFGEWLRAQREAQQLSQKELADKAGITSRTLRYWETEGKQPGSVELEQIFQVLAIPPAERHQVLGWLSAPRARRMESRLVPVAHAASTDPLLPHTGDLLQAMRVRVGKTQEQVARELGVHALTIRRWEALQQFPSPEALARLCQLLNADAEEVAVLASGQLSQGREWSGDRADLETLHAQVTKVELLVYQQSALADLYTLSLMRQLSLLRHRTSEATLLLVRVVMARGYLALYRDQRPQVKAMAQEALRLLAMAQQFDMVWSSSINLACAGFKQERSRDAIAFLTRHLPQAASGEARLPLLCDLALYWSQLQRGAEAQEVLRVAEATYRAAPESAFTHYYFLLSRGKVWLELGAAEGALQDFRQAMNVPTLTTEQRAVYLLYQAQAALGIQERRAAERLIQESSVLMANSENRYFLSWIRKRRDALERQYPGCTASSGATSDVYGAS